MASIIRTVVGSLATATLLAQPLWAQDQPLRTPEMKAFLEALISMDCTFSRETTPDLVKKSGLSNDEAMVVISGLMEIEAFEQGPNGEALLKEVYCKGGFDALPVEEAEEEGQGEDEEAMIAAILKRDCKFESTQAQAVMSETGLGPEASANAVAKLMQRGVLVPAGEVLVLKTEGCK